MGTTSYDVSTYVLTIGYLVPAQCPRIPCGLNIFHDDDFHLSNCPGYHENKERISLDDFDALLSSMQDRVNNGSVFQNIVDLQATLDRADTVILSPLPQDWSVAYREISTLDGPKRAYVNFMQCPKGTRNGCQKTSCSGLAKSVGTEAAMFGMIAHIDT
jgi:hypothetical protein